MTQETGNVIYALKEALESKGLKIDGGGGNSGGMEARIAKLEVTVEHIDRNVARMAPDLANVRERMGVLEERVAHLPGKGFIVVALLTSLAVVAALIAFSDQISALVSAGT